MANLRDFEYICVMLHPVVLLLSLSLDYTNLSAFEQGENETKPILFFTGYDAWFSGPRVTFERIVIGLNL
jgi:hypothetical protein